MTAFVRLLEWLFGCLLCLYPRAYQAECGEEMRVVFILAVEDSARQGLLSLVQLGLRELKDFPPNLLSAHLHHQPQKEKAVAGLFDKYHTSMTPVDAPRYRYTPDSWKHALWAALSQLPIALTMLISAIELWLVPAESRLKSFINLVQNKIDIGIGVMIIIVCIVVIVIWIRRRSLPRWGSAWMAYLMLGALTLLINIIGNFDTYNFYPWIFSVFILTYIILCMMFSSMDRTKGLLLSLSWLPYAMDSFFGEGTLFPQRFLTFMLSSMLYAGVILFVVRFGDWRKGLWLAVGARLLTGLVVAYAAVYHNNWGSMGYSYAPSPDKIITVFSGLVLSADFIIAPLLLLELGEVANRSNLPGIIGYWLLLVGSGLNITGNIGLLLSLNMTSQSNWFSIFFWLGMAMFFLGSTLLGIAVTYHRILPLWTGLLLLVLLFGAPLYWWRIADLPFWLLPGAGLVWMGIGCWLVTRLNTPMRSSAMKLAAG